VPILGFHCGQQGRHGLLGRWADPVQSQQASLSVGQPRSVDVAAPRHIATELVDQVFQQWPDEIGDEFIDAAIDLTNTNSTLLRTEMIVVPSPLRSSNGMSGPTLDSSLSDLINDLVESNVSSNCQITDNFDLPPLNES
jgi:hypothetical protein